MVPPKAHTLAGLPDAPMILAEIDPIASDGEMYAEAFRKAGVNVRLRTFSGVTHEFFGLGGILREATDAVKFASDGLTGRAGK